MSHYIIHLSRQEGRCIASIPELCIAEESANPEQALANIISAESAVIEKLVSSGLPLPLSVDKGNSYPRDQEVFMKVARFVGKVTAAFIIVMALSAAVAGMIYPTFKDRTMAYILSSASKEDVHKFLKHMGISACTEDKVKTDRRP